MIDLFLLYVNNYFLFTKKKKKLLLCLIIELLPILFLMRMLKKKKKRNYIITYWYLKKIKNHHPFCSHTEYNRWHPPNNPIYEVDFYGAIFSDINVAGIRLVLRDYNGSCWVHCTTWVQPTFWLSSLNELVGKLPRRQQS